MPTGAGPCADTEQRGARNIGALRTDGPRPRKLAQRAPIILACAVGQTNSVVAEKMHSQCVGRWRSRFISKHVTDCTMNLRPGAPRTISDAKVERGHALSLE